MFKKLLLTLVFFLLFISASFSQCFTLPSYCFPTFTNVNSYSIGLQNVTLGTTINNSSVATGNAPNYFDYTNLSVASTPGGTINLSVMNGSGNSTQARIFIDYNQDGSYNTSNEQVWSSSVTTAGAVVTGSFSIPSGQAGGIYRIRVTGDLGGTAASPCALGYGEVEDYTLVLTTSAIGDAAAFLHTSPASYNIGSNTVGFSFINLSTTTINTVDIGYQFGNNTPVLQSLSGLSVTAGNKGTANFTTPLTVAGIGNYNLKVWVNNINGAGTQTASNDTICRSFSIYCNGPLSGTYTIDPLGSGSANFLSFGGADSAMISCGISGPVLFNVAAGVYNEQINIPFITGASATNTIVFDGIDTSTRTITFATGVMPAVIRLNGAKYVTITRLKIVNTNTAQNSSGYYGVQLTNTALYNTVSGCKISVPIYGAGGVLYPVAIGICGSTYSTTDNSSNNTIDGNRMIGGYYGMTIFGNSSAPSASTGTKITNNKIEMAYYMGIYINYQNNFIIDHNVIINGPYYSNDYGIYAYYIGNTNITRNVVSSSYYGIMFYTYSSYNTGTCSVTNNMINSQGPGTYYYGLYMNNANNTNISHNTVYHTKASGAAFYNYISYTGNRVNNNIFMVTSSTAAAFYTANLSASYYISLDYNTIACPTGNASLIYWGGTYYPNITSLKAASISYNENQNNNAVIPIFQSAANLHLSTAIDQMRGMAGTGVAIDIDGETRCAFAPSIGADESGYLTAAPTAGFTVGPVYVNSPVTFLNNYSAALPMSHRWYVDGVLIGTSVNLTRSFPTATSYNLCLVSTNCFGTDSTCNTVTVNNPTAVPFSDFVVSPNTVNTNQNLNFIDNSTNGPTSWLWSISPGTLNVDYFFTSGTSASSKNPVVYFTTSGTYNICMQAANDIGSDSNRCKTNYIVVQAAQSMCLSPFITKVSEGNIYSSAGPSGGYGLNENCTFTIDACADSTFLNITAADFGTGTVDRFEIYQGDYIAGNIPVATFVGGTTYNNLPQIIKVKGKMTVREVTDATANNGVGIKANWYTTAGTFAAPAGSISGSNNAYYCTTAINNYYSSTFRDPTYNYQWDFDNDGLTDMTGMDGYFAYNAIGSDTIKLKITGCGGTVTVSKFVTVIDPPAPTADFSTTTFVATRVDTIPLIDLSLGGVSSWKWTITGPGTINYVGGTTNTSHNPKIMGFVAGNYTVKLVVNNCNGIDSSTKTNYFKILEYCTPTAGYLLTDLSVLNFQVASINNTVTSPAPGTIAYRDFTQSAFTNLDRGATYPFTLTRSANNNNNAGIKIWVDWNQDGVFDPVSELIASTVTGNLTWSSNLYTPKTAVLGSTRLRIGVAFNTLSNTPCGANMYGEFQDFKVIVRQDVTAPVLTLGGTNPTYVEIGRNFVESGDVAIDAVDGTLTDSIAYTGFITGQGYQLPISLQTTAVGTFTITASVSDLTANIATLQRSVIVTPDTTKPVITLNGANPLYVEVYNNFTDPGATASDFYFTSAISVIGTNTVDTAHLGTYTATYIATDINGNQAVPVTRTVIVRDTQKPVIVFPTGTDTVYLEVQNNYIDTGASVTDNYYTGLTATWAGTVNTYIPGTYYYTFSSIDGSGNIAQPRVRVIIVRDATPPELILASPSDPDTLVLEVKAYTTVPEPGYVATDNYYSSSQITVSKIGSIDLNKIGVYVITYIASDPSGNSSLPKRRIYKLVDRTKPVITVNGSISVNICRWRAYNDSGATVTDNYWNGLQLTTSNNVNVNLPGMYYVTYSASDSSGNIATTEQRYVRVLDYTSSSCQAYTGFNNNGSANTITVVPNPSSGLITIDIALSSVQHTEIIIYNSLGQIVKTLDNAEIANAKYTVDLTNEASGIYFVSVKSEINIYTKKFVLKK